MLSKSLSILFAGLLFIFISCRNNANKKEVVSTEVSSGTGAQPAATTLYPDGTTDNEAKLKNKKWKLYFINGKEPAPNKVSLVFNDSTFGGMGVCNSYGGKIKYSSNAGLHFSQLSSTEMACEGLEFEQRYFQFLQKVQTYRLHSDTLLLYDKSGMLPAMFVNIH